MNLILFYDWNKYKTVLQTFFHHFKYFNINTILIKSTELQFYILFPLDNSKEIESLYI